MKLTERIRHQGALLFVASVVAASASGQQVNYREELLGNLPAPEYEQGIPTAATAQRMLDQLLYQRAVQMYLWALPAVGMQQYRVANASAMGGGSDDYKVGYLGDLLKSSLVHLTGNPDSVYVDYFFDTSKGPIVLEVPPTLPGFLDDMWQRPVVDVIQPVSPSGRYLIVPPDWKGTAPAGFVVAKPQTYVSWLLLRGNVGKDGDTAVALADIKKLKIYPLSELGKAPSRPLQFFNISDAKIDRVPPEGLPFFERLGELVEHEHPFMQDPYNMGILSALGMESGKPFKPDDRTRQILTLAAETGQGMARTLTFRNEADKKIWPDRKFVMPFIGGDPNFTVNGRVLLDARAYFFYAACGTSKLMTSKTPGVGQAYPSGEMTGDGQYLAGDKTYKLHLPPKIPAKLYWSITLYDTQTRSILPNGTTAARISSFTNPVTNPDGSYDLYFGPTPVVGHEQNFVKTVPGKGWFFLFRLYGPEEAYFNGQWKPGDLVEVKSDGD